MPVKAIERHRCNVIGFSKTKLKSGPMFLRKMVFYLTVRYLSSKI